MLYVFGNIVMAEIKYYLLRYNVYHVKVSGLGKCHRKQKSLSMRITLTSRSRQGWVQRNITKRHCCVASAKKKFSLDRKLLSSVREVLKQKRFIATENVFR